MPYDIHSLRPDEADRAYALIQLANPHIDQTVWQAHSAAAVDASPGDEGVAVSTVGPGTLVGLFTWTIQNRLGQGRVFEVDNIVAAGPVASDRLLEGLLAYADQIAMERGCDAVRVVLPNPGSLPPETHAFRDWASTWVGSKRLAKLHS